MYVWYNMFDYGRCTLMAMPKKKKKYGKRTNKRIKCRPYANIIYIVFLFLLFEYFFFLRR